MNLQTLLLGSLGLLFSPSASASSAPADLPTLTLPWGVYQAQIAPTNPLEKPSTYLFENVRFGGLPVRFGPSAFPTGGNSSIQPSPPITDCLQINPGVLKNGPGGKDRLGDPNEGPSPDEFDASAPNVSGAEDCLFLDIYVPMSAYENPTPQKLPVNVWFYGGAYAFGTKKMDNNRPLYSGRSLLKVSGYNTIFVAGNYRLGAFGWLAGSYMEKNGLPNAGLYDQNLLLQWVQKYIGLVHGDNTTVSAWGESAGAGSILHHLIRGDGETDPLFSRFVTQSPAFEWAWDNSTGGQLDRVYQTFAKSAGCPAPYDIECLRDPSMSSATLAAANLDLFSKVKQTGIFPVGPAVDGKWIKTIPTLAFSQKKYWNKIKSAIVSHCANDAQHFTPTTVTTEAAFTNFLTTFLPGTNLASVRTSIANKYDCQKKFKGNYFDCLKHVIRDISFTCNTRDLIDSYPQQTYAMNYAYPTDDLAFHASDLVPLFVNNYVFQTAPMLSVLGMTAVQAAWWAPKLVKNVVPTYLNYFASFALTGTTNSLGNSGWPVVNATGTEFTSVMKPSKDGWNLSIDKQNSKEMCSFWNNMAQTVMNAQGRIVDADVEADVQQEL